MSKKRAPGRSLDEWMELVTECRQSGLTDATWGNEHGISPSCFYNAVTWHFVKILLIKFRIIKFNCMCIRIKLKGQIAFLNCHSTTPVLYHITDQILP